MLSERFEAAEMVGAACVKHKIHLAALIAETALWAHPQTHFRQIEHNGAAAVYPNVRRLRPGEKRGIVNGIRLDDNTYPNSLIKRRLGLRRLQAVGFECCHVWPNSCYDTRYHTVIANLVLIPAALASLTDHDLEVQASFQYRAYELYYWYPDEHSVPVKPVAYPDNWREPLPDPKKTDVPPPTQGPVTSETLLRWAEKPGKNVHRIIALMCDHSPISRGQLVAKIDALGISQNAYGAIASLMTNKGNAYGLVFVEQQGRLRIHPDIEPTVRRLWNRQRRPAAQ